MTTRCSSLPLRFTCGRSRVDGDVIFDHDIKAGREGTATHEMIRAHFQDTLTGESAKNICAFHGVEPAACWPLVNKAKAIVAELGLGKPDAMEEELDDGELSGHPDAEWVHEGAYWIGDWKSSRLDVNYFHQLMGYAWMRIKEIRMMPNGCHLFVAWLRDGTVERYHVTSDDVEAWAAKLEEARVSSVDPVAQYVTGAHCSHCSQRTDCPAQREDMRQALAVIDEGFAIDVSTMDGAMVAKVHRKLKMLANIKDAWDTALKNSIRANGPVDCGDGYQLALVPEKGKREIDTLKAWPVLAEALTDEELAPCLKVGVTALQEAVATKAQALKPRTGAEAKRKLWSALEAAEAVSQGAVEKLKEVRTQNLPTETKEIEG
jgi:hypothetical protein